jgi:hypothetical protein
MSAIVKHTFTKGRQMISDSTFTLQMSRADPSGSHIQTIPANSLGPEVKEAFSRGQCHSLALALHEMLDVPLCLVVAAKVKETLHMSVAEIQELEELPDEVAAFGWNHALVRIDSDRYLDIQGIHAHEGVLNDYLDPENYFIAPTTARQLDAFAMQYGTAVWPDMKAGRHYAELVVRAYLDLPALALAH